MRYEYVCSNVRILKRRLQSARLHYSIYIYYVIYQEMVSAILEMSYMKTYVVTFVTRYPQNINFIVLQAITL